MKQEPQVETFSGIVRGRKSVRGFKPDPVPQEVLRSVFSLAQCAPSNCNTQPWLAAVVSGPYTEQMRRIFIDAYTRRRFDMDYPFSGEYAGVYRERQCATAALRYESVGAARDDEQARRAADLRNFELYDAPHAAFLFLPDWAGVREAADLGMYAQTLMLSLTAHGVACCPQTSLSFCAQAVREALGVGSEFKLLLGVTFGYENAADRANSYRTGRASLESAVRFYPELEPRPTLQSARAHGTAPE